MWNVSVTGHMLKEWESGKIILERPAPLLIRTFNYNEKMSGRLAEHSPQIPQSEKTRFFEIQDPGRSKIYFINRWTGCISSPSSTSKQTSTGRSSWISWICWWRPKGRTEHETATWRALISLVPLTCFLHWVVWSSMKMGQQGSRSLCRE